MVSSGISRVKTCVEATRGDIHEVETDSSREWLEHLGAPPCIAVWTSMSHISTSRLPKRVKFYSSFFSRDPSFSCLWATFSSLINHTTRISRNTVIPRKMLKCIRMLESWMEYSMKSKMIIKETRESFRVVKTPELTPGLSSWSSQLGRPTISSSAIGASTGLHRGRGAGIIVMPNCTGPELRRL